MWSSFADSIRRKIALMTDYQLAKSISTFFGVGIDAGHSVIPKKGGILALPKNCTDSRVLEQKGIRFSPTGWRSRLALGALVRRT